LQKFPSSAELWILAAQYEYDTNLNFSGAQNLLLRSLRLNPEKQELWWEFSRLACSYVVKLLERRRILGLDKPLKEMLHDKTGFQDQNEIELPTISMEELQKADDPQLDPLLTSPLSDVSTNPVLNGAIPKAILASAISSRPNDLILISGFYEVFLSFHSKLAFIDSILDTLKKHIQDTFPGRGITLFIRVIDHARGLEYSDTRFPRALREMMNTSSSVTELVSKERTVCCSKLIEYLEAVSQTDELEVNLRKAIAVFVDRVQRWKDTAER
jgi:U3 small nucleolar RNA-associated protein 6